MTKPFKFRYVNEIAGVFVLLIVILFIAGIVLAGFVQGWFESYHRLTLDIPAEGLSGLQEGAEVEILGAVVGSVESLIVNDKTGDMEAVAAIRSDFFSFVKQDSQAFIRKRFIFAGDTYVEITRGEGAPIPDKDRMFRMTCEPGREILTTIQEFADEIRESRILDSIMEMSFEIQAAVLGVLTQARNSLERYTTLVVDLRETSVKVQTLLERIDGIVQKTEAGEGTVGMLLTDSTLAEKTISIAGKVETTIDEVDAVLRDVHRMTAGLPDAAQMARDLETIREILENVRAATELLPAMAETAGAEIEDIPGMIRQIRQNLREAEELVEAVKRHWLIRKYVETAEPPATLPPSLVTPSRSDKDSAPGRSGSPGLSEPKKGGGR